MSDQNTVLSQSFYLRLQPDRQISISIRYNKKPNGPFQQQDELSMYIQSFNQQIQQRSFSLNKSNLLSRRNSRSASSKKNTLQQLLFKQIEQQPKENEVTNNNNQQTTTPRKNILNLQFKQEANQQINQILSNNKQQNAITKFKSFLINKQKILNKTEVQTSFDDENDLLAYNSPLKSKNQTDISNIMYTSPDVNSITPPRCATASEQVRRRYSNQLLNSVMKDKNRSYSQQNKIIDCKQIPNSSKNSTTLSQDIQNASDIQKQFDIENNSQFRESLINQDFIQYFRFFNKRFIEDNLKVYLETSKKLQELNEVESSCSADVMMRIQIPEKSKENLSKYESLWRQHYKVQYRYQDLTQSNKKLPFNQFSQKYNLSQLIYTPYDLFIIIEDISIQHTKRAVEFLLLNSYENDRVCLVYVQNNQICNTPLLNCNQQNKNYLKNIIQNVQYTASLSQDQKVGIFERLKNLIEQRFQVNFLTQAIWFTHGVSLKQTTQITYKYNLIDKKFRFQISVFEYVDENIKSFINKLVFQSSGNYYIIPQNESEQTPFVTETLCQIKRTISFKCSGMVRRLTELEYAQYNQNEIKNTILPKIQILCKYGGKKVWKEDTIFQGNQILIPYLQHNSDYKYYINYQFQLEQQRKYNQIEDQKIPILKVVCLCFLDQIKNSDYVFKQSSLELQFSINTLRNQVFEENLKIKQDHNSNNSNDQIIPDQTVQQVQDQSMFQLKYNCIAMISSLTNVKDISYIRNQLNVIQDSFLKSYEQYMQADQYEGSKILSLLQELNTFAQQSSVHYCSIMIENVVYSLLRSKNPFFQ